MIEPLLLQRLRREVEARLAGSDPAHDFGHVQRTVTAAERIAAGEGADRQIVHLAALLHEWVNFPKGHPESSRSGQVCAEQVRELLAREGMDRRLGDEVCECIRVHAFSAGLEARSLEAKVLQDADRLDAIGAIGVARCFATCASMKLPLYHPDDPFCELRPPDDRSWGLDHFYRKLLKIPEALHTPTAREIGRQRASFLRLFLSQLRNEITLDR
jgi:uncharacterized protein